MKEWMQLRGAILDRLELSREKENELHLVQQHATGAAAQIKAQLAAFGSQLTGEDTSLAILLKVADRVAAEADSDRRTVEDIRRRLELLSLDRLQAKRDEWKARLSEWSQKWSPFVTGLLLSNSAAPDRVGEALTALERVFDHLKEADRLQYRVKRIGENIARRSISGRKVRELVFRQPHRGGAGAGR